MHQPRTPDLDLNGTSLRGAGYLVLDRYLEPADCRSLLDSIRRYREQYPVPEIHRPAKGRPLRYAAIDGGQIRRHLPVIWDLYVGAARELVHQLTEAPLEPLANERVGVNVNLMPPGRSSYRWHYDRTPITAILYLNEVEGGETELYPNYRFLLNGRSHGKLQRILDRVLVSRPLRMIFGKRIVVRPRTGRLVVMRANRCWHSVRGVQGDRERINIIMAYDAPGASFPSEAWLDTYLYTQREVPPDDPNYTS